MDQFTQGLYIPEEYIHQSPRPEISPVKHTLGSYQPILQREKLQVPAHALYYPKGKYLTCKVVLSKPGELEGRQLEPLVSYAHANGYRLVGNGTAFLFRIARLEEGLQFLFRVRIRAVAAGEGEETKGSKNII